MELFIEYKTIFTRKGEVLGWSIDYADNTLRGIIDDYTELIFLKFSDYGIFFDNRFGKGYTIISEETGIRIKLKKLDK